MDQSLREVVRRRAGNTCEYCHLPQEATPLIAFHVEHIVSRQHGGSDDPGGWHSRAIGATRTKGRILLASIPRLEP